MKVLAIDTSTSYYYTSLISGDEVRHEGTFKPGRDNDNALHEHFLSLKDRFKIIKPDILCIGTGPGSFTGLRVGLAYFKIISLTAGIPMVAVNSMELWWNAFKEQLPGSNSWLLIMINRVMAYGIMYDSGFHFKAATIDDWKNSVELKNTLVWAPGHEASQQEHFKSTSIESINLESMTAFMIKESRTKLPVTWHLLNPQYGHELGFKPAK